MAFATNQLLETFAPDVFNQGVSDWSAELQLAETDVLNMIRVKYWNRHHIPTDFRSDRLVTAQWGKATVYQALAAYIMPKLSTFRPEDVFTEQMTFYKERFSEEFELQLALGVQYDADDSGTISDAEITEYSLNRLNR
jgi:hypothetical protein